MSIADNILKSGFHSVEGMGREDRHGQDVEYPELVVREATSDEFDSFTLNVFGEPQLIVPADPQRTKLSIRNLGTTNVVIGKQSQVSSGLGYLLPPNGALNDLETTAAVYIGPDVPRSQTIAKVSVWIERAAG